MNKMDVEKKIKLIFSGELIGISLVLLVIGILKLIGIIPTDDNRLLVYNIITTIGGVYFLGDGLWAIFSKKRRKKICLLDKLIVLPVAAYLMFFDISCYIHAFYIDDYFIKISIGVVLIYIAIVYIFLGIYHYFVPSPQILEAIEEAKQEEKEKQIVVTATEINNEVKEDNK